ncbi:TetR/AcrR family transcriptional regulator [Demequina lutea]|uniref:AcrR family transcriptional regulator n=1 Tax=Demequina lutea TaxID=431489 RepID=A0A7Y9Z8M1_9MICO|nr:TetR family transcriptional regulator [Demequina lutea]NYI40250.1 AcrR family transcriptional regulator [Demequina lutea]
MTSATEGRRESKRRETRDALIASATSLFAERGYQATTIAAIAAGAGVAPRTFFGYFPTKEAVLFWPFDVLAANLEEALSDGPDDALTTLRTWAHAHSAWFDTDFRDLRRLIETASQENHTVAITGLLFIQRLSVAVASRLRLDLGVGPDDAMPDMAAAAAVAALTVALPMGMACRSTDGPPDLSRNLLDDLDTAIGFARAGLEATRPVRA